MPPNVLSNCYPVPYKRYHPENGFGVKWRATVARIKRNQKGIFIAVGIFLCLGIAGELDYRMQVAQCEIEKAGFWPAYDHTKPC